MNDSTAGAQREPISIGGDRSRQERSPKFECMTKDERIEYLQKMVERNPLHREIHYQVLKFCTERHILSDVEAFIATCSQFASASQSQFFLLQFLIDGGGIDSFELDREGQVIEPGQKVGLSEDEIDDLIVQFAYQTNEIGQQVADNMSPKKRLQALLDLQVGYKDTYLEILDFLQNKHDFSELDTLLRGRDILMLDRSSDDRPIQPSVLIDKLEKCGAIYWDKGWIASAEITETLRGKEWQLGKQQTSTT